MNFISIFCLANLMQGSSAHNFQSSPAFTMTKNGDLARMITHASPDDDKLRARVGTLWPILQRLDLQWSSTDGLSRLSLVVVSWAEVRLHRSPIPNTQFSIIVAEIKRSA